MRYLISAVLSFAFICGPAHGCSWVGISRWNVWSELPPRFSEAEAVVRARVESVKVRQPDSMSTDGRVTIGLNEYVATLVVLDAFKGGARRMEVSGSSSMCGYRFKVGEEMIYFISKGNVGIPDVEPVSAWLTSALAARRAAATPNKSLERTRER